MRKSKRSSTFKVKPKKAKTPPEPKPIIGRIFERVVYAYDCVLPGGKVYRWDDPKSAMNFVRMHRITPRVFRLKGITAQMAKSAVLKTLPNALIDRSVNRKLVKGQAHSVEKE